jgi:biotin operon repressor
MGTYDPPTPVRRQARTTPADRTGTAPPPLPPLKVGPSPEAAERDARLLADCQARGHEPRKSFGGRQVACMPCTQHELLGSSAWTSEALPVSLQAEGTLTRRIFDHLADGGEYSVEGLAGQLGANQQSVSALIRDLRKLGYTIRRTRRDGVSVYRMERP